MMYNLIHKLLCVPFEYLFKCNQDSRTRGNSWKLCVNYCQLNITKNSFANHMLSTWNVLPDTVLHIVSAPSVSQFKQYCNFDSNL